MHCIRVAAVVVVIGENRYSGGVIVIRVVALENKGGFPVDIEVGGSRCG